MFLMFPSFDTNWTPKQRRPKHSPFSNSLIKVQPPLKKPSQDPSLLSNNRQMRNSSIQKCISKVFKNDVDKHLDLNDFISRNYLFEHFQSGSHLKQRTEADTGNKLVFSFICTSLLRTISRVPFCSPILLQLYNKFLDIMFIFIATFMILCLSVKPNDASRPDTLMGKVLLFFQRC